MPWETCIIKKSEWKDEVAEENKEENKQVGEQSQDNIVS